MDEIENIKYLIGYGVVGAIVITFFFIARGLATM
jgi:hypothetical protein